MSNSFFKNVRKTKKYGWKRGLPDHRNLLFHPKMSLMLPTTVDLRPQCPAVYDQGSLGSCTANAIGGMVQFLQMKEKISSFVPSRLFIYYNERVLEGSVGEDAGAAISDGMKVVNKLGSPYENLWWYDIKKFTVKPNKKVYDDAKQHLVSSYMKVDNTNLTTMKSCLAEGFPVVGGFTVYESFESAKVASTGVVPMPSKKEQVLGGHAILVVGYNDAKSWFIVRNSWGNKWALGGYFYMPYAYFTNGNLADDFWTARLVS